MPDLDDDHLTKNGRAMSQPEQVTIRQPDEGRTIGIVGDIYRFLVTVRSAVHSIKSSLKKGRHEQL